MRRSAAGLVTVLLALTNACGLAPYPSDSDEPEPDREPRPPAQRPADEAPPPTWQKLADGPDDADPIHCSSRWVDDQLLLWTSPTASQVGCTPRRWDPATSRWVTVPSEGSPALVSWFTAAAAGELIVYGAQSSLSNGAARFDPTSDSWHPISTFEIGPQPTDLSPVSTGEGVIFWGGHVLGSDLTNWQAPRGAVYQATEDRWIELTTVDEPSPRSRHATTWDGTHMLVFGGMDYQGEPLSDGHVWDATSNAWEPFRDEGRPSPRFDAAATFTGTHYIVFGGTADGERYLNDGGLYLWNANTWQVLPPPHDDFHPRHPVAFWTGEDVLVVQTTDAPLAGALFDPSTRSWSALEMDDALADFVVVRTGWHRESNRYLFWGFHRCAQRGCQRRWEAWSYRVLGDPPPEDLHHAAQ